MTDQPEAQPETAASLRMEPRPLKDGDEIQSHSKYGPPFMCGCFEVYHHDGNRWSLCAWHEEKAQHAAAAARAEGAAEGAARIHRLERDLRWALRHDGGECPADDPAAYAEVLADLLAPPEAREPGISVEREP